MPVDWSRYPKDWKQIRQRILERDGHCCKFCGIENYAVVRWVAEWWERICGSYYLDGMGTGQYSYQKARECADISNQGNDDYRWIVIVLTIMHLDHDTENNEESNLASGCQRCHNNHDQKHRRKNSRATIEKKKHLQRLF